MHHGDAIAHNFSSTELDTENQPTELSFFYLLNSSTMATVALRAVLRGIGFTQDAATYIVDTQGFDTAEDFAMLSDDEATNLCKVTRRPGGLNNQNNPNPGLSVSLKAENNLKLMCYYYRFRQRTSRPLTINLATTDTIRKYISRKRVEYEHEDPSPPELNFKNWTRTVDIIEDYLRNCLGTTKIPLAYIIRENVAVPDDNTDPADNYPNYIDELIARAPHVIPGTNDHTQHYKDDNIAVFNKLSAMLRDKDCWTYMQRAQRSRDGRLAFMSLKEHYLGKNNVDNLATYAERKLQSTSYTGEGRRWNFEKFVKTHVDQHQVLTDLTRHGYAGIDPRSKVRYLLDGIKTNTLAAVKTQIMADTRLRNDFDACVNLFQDFIKHSNTEPRQANISALGRDPRGQLKNGNEKSNFDDIEPDMSVEDRYYKKSEYNKLSAAKKKGLALKRVKRGHKPGAKDSPKGPPHKGKRTFKKRVISAVKAYLKKDQPDDTSDDSSTSSMEVDEEIPMKQHDGKQPTNRNVKALKRKHT